MRKGLVAGGALGLGAAVALAAAAVVGGGPGLAAGAGAPAGGGGAKVYVNGVDMVSISGIRGTTYTNVTVAFDAAGAVHLTIPGFAVTGPPGTKGPAPATGAPPPAGKKPLAGDVAALPLKFYLVTEVARPGFVQYDIEVWVNDAYIGMIKNEDGPIAVDVHAHVKAAGKNTLRFKATKRTDADRRSTSSADYLKVILAEGRLVSGAVLPETRLFEYTRTAADVASSTTEYMIEIKR